MERHARADQCGHAGHGLGDADPRRRATHRDWSEPGSNPGHSAEGRYLLIMKWTRGESRQNVDDLRGTVRPGGGLGGALGGLGGRGVRLSGGTLILLLVVFAIQYFVRGGGGTTSTPSQPSGSHSYTGSPAEEEAADFVTFVLNDTQRTWKRILGDKYQDARLALFSGSVESGCGYAGAEMGPFYCPADHRAYLDLSSFAQLRERFGAPGDF